MFSHCSIHIHADTHTHTHNRTPRIPRVSAPPTSLDCAGRQAGSAYGWGLSRHMRTHTPSQHCKKMRPTRQLKGGRGV
jgi:hypothetical protein